MHRAELIQRRRVVLLVSILANTGGMALALTTGYTAFAAVLIGVGTTLLVTYRRAIFAF